MTVPVNLNGLDDVELGGERVVRDHGTRGRQQSGRGQGHDKLGTHRNNLHARAVYGKE